jgi:hypothetical protein
VLKEYGLIGGTLFSTTSDLPNLKLKTNNLESLSPFLEEFDIDIIRDIGPELEVVLTSLPQPFYQQTNPDDNNSVTYSVGVDKMKDKTKILLHIDESILNQRYENWEMVIQKAYITGLLEGLSLASGEILEEKHPWTVFTAYYTKNYSLSEIDKMPLILISNYD